ncbi:SDR family NAD(P)-dependent oxidoreductase [Enterovirga aerilata]|uniref:SDR family oxidoreductase n=1 Tax=Enterovirga aerilata TaxID=2730920 RepID=A0A849I1U7_9HYPH|nr:SDR family oxidoreductase [Enterovirga sp. DB1703]NNM71318.1 SDR family oxidoreductase [Enterovirga sp. DB1703]
MNDPRWAVITGASSGIGAEMARIYAGRGRSLVLAARREARLAELKAEIGSRHPDARIETVVLDLEEPDGAEALMAELDRRGIELETLVNNAGFGLRGGFATLPYRDQLAMLQLNVVSLTQLCRLALPGLAARRRGGIINVASTAAFQAIPYMAAYAATKAYVLSLSEALHEEAGRHGVVVTALCPGPTATEFSARADLERSRMFERPMSAAEVAQAGIDGHEAGRAVVIPGASNRLGAIGAKLAPRRLARQIAGWLQRPKG